MGAGREIFDRRLLRRKQRRRAGKTEAPGGGLLDHAAGEIGGRLAMVRRDFPLALDLSWAGARIPDENGKIGRRVQGGPGQAAGGGVCLEADEEALPFRAGSFALITSALTLHWVNDLPGALGEIRRALAPDGLFVGALFAAGTLAELRACLIEAESGLTGGASPRIAPFAELAELGRALQQAGFAMPVADLDRLCLRYDDLRALLGDLDALGPGNILRARRGGFLRRDVLAQAGEIYRRRFADADGRLPARFNVAYVTGWGPGPGQPRPLAPGSARGSLGGALEAIRRERLKGA